MAQKPQRERTATSTTRTTQNTFDAATTKPSFISRFIPSRVDRATTTAATTDAKPKSPWRKLLFGMLIFIVAMQVFEYVLFFVGAKLNLNLGATLGKGVPLIGGMTWFTFIYLLFMLALYIGLLRFGVIPNGKALRTQRAAAAAQPAAPAATSHAARKRAARHAATTTATTVSTARRTATSARVKSGQGAAATTASAAGLSDDAYERVKAAQRTRRRRDAKR